MHDKPYTPHKEHGNKKHGHCKPIRSKTYESWAEIIKRCTNRNCKAFPNYGGRGITVCTRWRSFEHFLEDMGERPIGKMIDRIDNNGNYEPGNCRWATRKEQNRNKRSNRIFTFKGITACLADLCDMFHVPYYRVQARIKALGWSIDDAMTKPVDLYKVRIKG